MDFSSYQLPNNDLFAYVVTIEHSVEEQRLEEVEESNAASASANQIEECDANQSKVSENQQKAKKSSKLLTAFRRKNKKKWSESDSQTSIIINDKPEISTCTELKEEGTDATTKDANPFISDVGVNTDQEKPKHQSFIRKLISKQARISKSEGEPKLQENVSIQTSSCSCDNEICIREYSMGGEGSSFERKSEGNVRGSSTNYFNYSSFLKAEKTSSSRKIEGELKDLIDLMSHLSDSENHLVKQLERYIRDNSFKSELLECISNHSKVRLDAERRAQNLANEMWQQQIEIHKFQERNLQESFNQLTKQNRKLLDDNERLMRKSEQFKQQSHLHAPLPGRNYEVAEQLNRTIDRLQGNANSLTGQIDELEDELQKLQRTNSYLEDQLNTSGAQVRHYKMMLQRTQTDHELEQASLAHQLEINQLLIKESVEAGDVLLEDLDGMKRQMKSLPCSLNWTKFKSRGSNLVDLIHICRACVNEFSRELITCQSQLQIKDKDFEALREHNKRLQENLKRSATELDKIDERLEISRIYELEKNEYKTRNLELEQKLKDFTGKVERLNQDLEQGKAQLVTVQNEKESLDQEVRRKEHEIENFKALIQADKSENETLRKQIEGLNNILSSSGAGDVIRELSALQEKLQFFQSQYYQINSEKCFLSEQLNACNVERETLIQYQHTYYQHFQNLQKETEEINQENAALKEQRQVDMGVISALQNEKTRHLEEKNILRCLYQQLNNEIVKVEQLEGAVADMSKEANRLALIAEYNKQLGDKLKTEVEERDQTISKLQDNVEVLSNIQMENAKDKYALCFELTEVCTIKDQLNNTLSMEMQKNIHLDEKRKELENTNNFQLKKVEEMQRAERVALKELLKDFKNVVAQRNQLIDAHNESTRQIAELHKVLKINQKSCSEYASQNKQKDLKISDLEGQLKQKGLTLESALAKVDDQASKYENTLENLYSYTDQLKKDKENLESSVKYLQNNTQKLHNDLNDARKDAKEARDQMEKFSESNETLNKKLTDNISKLQDICNENESLKTEVKRLNYLSTHILQEYETNITTSMQNVQTTRLELDKTKETLETSMQNYNILSQALREKEEENENLKVQYLKLLDHNESLKATVSEIEVNNKEVMHACILNSKIKNELVTLAQKQEFSMGQFNELAEMVETISKQMNINLEIYDDYKNQIDEIHWDNKKLKGVMQHKLNTLTEKFNETIVSYEEDKRGHQKLAAAHKDLAAKLLNSLRMLIDEKISRQNVESKIAELTQKYVKVKTEKQGQEQKLDILTRELEDLKTRTAELDTDKRHIQSAYVEIQSAYKETVAKCEKLENELKIAEQKCKEINVTSNNETMDDVVLRCVISEERTLRLKEELKESHELILEQKKEISKLQQEMTTLEFQKCELSLRLHETRGKLATEENLYKEMKHLHGTITSKILELKEKGVISDSICENLLFVAKSNQLKTRPRLGSEHNLTISDRFSVVTTSDSLLN